MKLSVRLLLTLVSLVAAGGFLTRATLVSAGNSNKHQGWENEQSDQRPGNGFGDDNHEHTGPPGQTSVPERPGHGYGDDNHEHTGPPGQTSVPERPGHGHGDDNHEHTGPPGHDDD